MAKSIRSYLPEYEDDSSRMVQARVGNQLFEKANRIRIKRHLQWQELFTALLTKYVDDIGPLTFPPAIDEVNQMQMFPEDPRLVK